MGVETISDVDGNIYNTIKIGNQVWTVENLKTTKFNDGKDIPNITSNGEWADLETPAYCWYDNDIINKDKYGGLYNWFTIQTEKIAPNGWHVPTDIEWTELEKYLINNGYNWNGTTGGIMAAKSLAAKTDWKYGGAEGTVGNDVIKNNKSGFSALPGGFRYYDGSFNYEGTHGSWWSATDIIASRAIHSYIQSSHSNLIKDMARKRNGFSVRCIKD